MWMGGVVPLGVTGSRTARCTLSKRMPRSCVPLFRRYLEAGSVVRLKQQLDAEEVRLPVRIDGTLTRSSSGDELCRHKPRKCHAILRTRKSRRFARTCWWWTQSLKTGLGRGIPC